MRRMWAPGRGEGTRGSRTALLLVVLGVFCALFPGSAEAQQRQQRRAPGRTPERVQEPRVLDSPAARELVDRFSARAAEALHLSPGQSDRLRSVLHESRRERMRLESRQRQVRRELAALIRNGTADQERIGRLMDEFLELRVRLVEVDMAENRRLAEFLSPLQRARFFTLKQRFAQRALRQQTDRQRPDDRRRPQP